MPKVCKLLTLKLSKNVLRKDFSQILEAVLGLKVGSTAFPQNYPRVRQCSRYGFHNATFYKGA